MAGTSGCTSCPSPVPLMFLAVYVLGTKRERVLNFFFNLDTVLQSFLHIWNKSAKTVYCLILFFNSLCWWCCRFFFIWSVPLLSSDRFNGRSKASKLRWRRKTRWGRSFSTTCRWSWRQTGQVCSPWAEKPVSSACFSFGWRDAPGRCAHSSGGPWPPGGTGGLSCRKPAWCCAGRPAPWTDRTAPFRSSSPPWSAGCRLVSSVLTISIMVSGLCDACWHHCDQTEDMLMSHYVTFQHHICKTSIFLRSVWTLTRGLWFQITDRRPMLFFHILKWVQWWIYMLKKSGLFLKNCDECSTTALGVTTKESMNHPW